MLIRSLLSIFMLSTSIPAIAHANSFNDSVVFSRQKLTIDSVRYIPITPAPKEETDAEEEEGVEETGATVEKAEEEIEYEEQDVAYAFDVMVKFLALVQAGSLQQLGWLKHDEGMMLIFDASDVVSLADLGITADVDVIFIRPNGIIDAIAPRITPEQMSGAVETRKPVVAALLLKSGMSEHLNLEPGNQVNHKHFQPDTRVLR